MDIANARRRMKSPNRKTRQRAQKVLKSIIK
ncbi:putative metal homeostasis protein [Aerococcus urinaeequi]|uniref:Metal homeostasis protein n=1 Tax=Aerococcus urinaeequi TaxID=51665 RepID=A0AAF0BHD6_9LACT|nr:putative metal homeostasis protein [Aerococcus urinaeequi]WCG37244.1 putative metal homeostasis protein [Aerococcus urinaeequi]